MAETVLNILLELKDQATEGIKKLGEQSESTFKKMTDQAAKVGIGMVIAGGAITGAIGYMVKEAAEEEAITGSLKTALEALQSSAQSSLASSKDYALQTEVLINTKKRYQAQLDQLEYSLTAVKKGHKDTAAATAETEAKMQGLQMKIEQVNVKLQTHANMLSNAKVSIEDEMKTVREAQKANEDYGFSSEDTSNAIRTLIVHTKNLPDAIKDVSIAMDLARFKHEDLATASTQLGMVLEGGGRAAKMLGVNMKDTATPMEAMIEIQKQLTGQAKNYTQTLAGQMDILGVRQKELGQALGEKLIPILISFVEKVNIIIGRIQDWADKHPQLAKNIMIIVAVIGLLLIPMGTFLTLLPGIIALFGLLAGVSLPVVAAIVGITAVVGILGYTIYKLYTDWKYFWAGIVADFQDKVNQIKHLFDAVMTPIKSASSFLGNVGKSVGGAISSIIPHFASGGIVSSPTLALIGEAGPEAVVPLGGMGGSFSGSSGSVSNMFININNGMFLDQNSARKMANVIAKLVNQNNKLRTF